MRGFFVGLLAFLVAMSAHAGSSSFVVAVARGQVPVAVRLELPADYVVVPISLASNEKDPLRNIESLQTYTQRLQEAVSKSPAVKLRQGTVSLAVTPAEEGGFSSSYKMAGMPSTASLFLVAPLTADRDVYQVARDIIAFAQTVAKPEQVRITFGTTALGVEAPERLRPRLLALIQKDIEQTRAALGTPKSYEVSGLESPVVVMQGDDRNVVVYLPYRLQWGP